MAKEIVVDTFSVKEGELRQSLQDRLDLIAANINSQFKSLNLTPRPDGHLICVIVHEDTV